ncbi:MAG: hypothetical protein IPO04_08400 [Cytophagaceae bacterium]|nr:hypothetical protein [Cytophagaceae bacterium]
MASIHDFLSEIYLADTTRKDTFAILKSHFQKFSHKEKIDISLLLEKSSSKQKKSNYFGTLHNLW